MPEPFKIKCRYCGNIYVANKKNRSHCRRSACRDKEIQRQLSQLQAMLEMLCTNNIKAYVEIRLAGNDKISHEAKIESISNVAKGVVVAIRGNTNNNKNKKGVMSEDLMPYFRILLWKGIKGNFIITIYDNGTIDPNILNQTFTPLSMPTIIGNNMMVSGGGEKHLFLNKQEKKEV